ncbi:MAG: competence protein ComJ [Acidobacteriota bacterium]
MLISEFEVEFSYISFSVYDSNVNLPGNESTDDHFNQGFARRDSSVNFRALLEFGLATVHVFDDDYKFEEADERVIKVPFYCPSGKVFVDGPEENEPHTIDIQPGHYQLTAAQRANYDDESLFIRLYLFKVETSSTKSEILIQDKQLDPPKQLLESAEITTF